MTYLASVTMRGIRGRRMVSWALCIVITLRPLHQSLKARRKSSHIGISAKGAEMGIPITLHHSHFVCIACVSLPPYPLNTSNTFSSLPKLPLGNPTTTAPVPPLNFSSSFRLAFKGGTLFNPHSRYGIRSNSLLPYTVTFFCHPFSYDSHCSHVVVALVVILSM